MAYAFVRNLRTSSGANLKNFAQIQSAEAHAKRQDLTSQSRQEEGRSHEANYFWSKIGEGLAGGGADYTAAFRAHKAELGVKSERKGAAIGQHLLVGVSPEWLAATGDPRDLKNERVKAVIEHAKAWAESWMGEGAVWAVRYDTDERGAGIVDILASPVREGRAGRGRPKPQISINKAKNELQDRVGTRNSYEAMQTDWARYAQEHLDPALKRGEPKTKTNREHATPEQFKERLAEIERREADVEAREKNIKDGLLHRLTRRDPSAADQVKAAIEAQSAAERRTEAAERERDHARQNVLEGLSEAVSEARRAYREGKGMMTKAQQLNDQTKALRVENQELTEKTAHFSQKIADQKSQIETLEAEIDRATRAQRKLEDQASTFRAWRDMFVEAVTQFLGPRSGDLAEIVNRKWRFHPENPDRDHPENGPSQGPS